MTLKERRFYQLAIFISLALHAAFLLIYLPQKLLDKPVEIDTFAVGVVEMPFGNATGGPQALIAAVAPAGVNIPALTKPSIPASGKPKAVLPKMPATSEVKTEKIEAKTQEKPIEKSAAPLVVAPSPAPTKPVKPAETAVNSDNPATGEKGGSGLKSGDGKETDDDKNGPGKGDGGPGGPGGPGTAPFVAKGLGTGDQMYSGGGGGGGFPSYPKNLLNEGKEGDVEVQLFIKTDGSLEKYEVIHSSGDQGLVKPVKTYIERQLTKAWKPYEQNYYVIVLFSFKANTGTVIMTRKKSETRP